MGVFLERWLDGAEFEDEEPDGGEMITSQIETYSNLMGLPLFIGFSYVYTIAVSRVLSLNNWILPSRCPSYG
jgi:hypothetical protein